jgi:hypothetical protein
MPATQTIRRLPPLRNSGVSAPMQFWELETQQAAPLVEGDTSAGPESYALPPAGLNSSTGQTNQNQEITVIKSTPDANAFTVTGATSGDVALTAQYQSARFKSNGTNWLRVG